MVAAAVIACMAGCSAVSTSRPAESDTPSRQLSGPPSPTAVPEIHTPPAGCDSPCYTEARTVGSLAGLVEEVSGMAASRRHPGVYYAVSDEPGTSGVVAVREDGSLVAPIEIATMDAENAEALAVGTCGPASGTTCLYVGDIGDHVGREDIVVYRLLEPDVEPAPRDAVPADVLRFTYPGDSTARPIDAEALLVDDAGRPLIITKAPFDRDTGETGTTSLYRGPADGGVLERIGDIDLPDPERGLLTGLVGNVVTGASATDGHVLLRTYHGVLEYRAGEPGADLSGFPRWPVRPVPAPGQIQSETITHRSGSCGYLTTSELTGDIASVDCAG